MNRLLFLSRHYPTEAQVEMARQMGYTGIEPSKTTFPNDIDELKKLIDKINLKSNIVALSAPTWVHVTFWEKSYTTIEFVSEGETRDDPDWHGIFICKGLWVYTPTENGVRYSYHACDMDRETQVKFMGYEIEHFGKNSIDK